MAESIKPINNPRASFFYVEVTGSLNGRKTGNVFPANPSSFSYNGDMDNNKQNLVYKTPMLSVDGVDVVPIKDDELNPKNATRVDLLFRQDQGEDVAIVASVRLTREQARELKGILNDSSTGLFT